MRDGFRLALFAVLLAVLFGSTSQLRADVCTYTTIKVRRVCGIALDTSNRPIPNAVITVLEDGRPPKSLRTGDDGQFDFDGLPPGKYELKVAATGFMQNWYPLEVSGPIKACKKALRVEMAVGSISGCGGDMRLTRKSLETSH